MSEFSRRVKEKELQERTAKAIEDTDMSDDETDEDEDDDDTSDE